MNIETGPVLVGIDDLLKYREQLPQRRIVSSRLDILPYRLEIPERGVYSVIVIFRWPRAVVREMVRDHTPIQKLRESPQNFARYIRAASYKTQAGQADHCVPSPVREPVVTGNNALPLLLAYIAIDDELVCRQNQSLHPFGCGIVYRGTHRLPRSVQLLFVSLVPVAGRRAVEIDRAGERRNKRNAFSDIQGRLKGPGAKHIFDVV